MLISLPPARRHLMNLDRAEFRQLLLDQKALTRTEKAKQILPADTSFAVVVEVVELPQKAPTSTTPDATMPMRPVKPPRDKLPHSFYIGYAALVGGELRLIDQEGTVRLSSPAAQVRMTREEGNYTIYAGGQRVCLEGPILPISGRSPFPADGTIKGAGMGALLQRLKQQGATIEFSLARQNAITIGIFIFIFAATFLLLIFASQHR